MELGLGMIKNNIIGEKIRHLPSNRREAVIEETT